MAPKSVITGLSATVKTERGRKILRQGDALPEDVLPGEAHRLAELGVYGIPKDRNADKRDEAQVLADDLAAQHAAEEAARGNPEEVTEAVVEDGAGESSEGEESDETPELEEDRVGLAAYLKTAKVAEVLDRVAQEPDVAPMLLELEQEATKPRKSLVSGLEAVVEDAGE